MKPAPVTFISVQGTYNKIELALFCNDHCLDHVVQIDVKASSHLIPLLQNMLEKHSLTLSNLSFIAVDHGPGAFTSLRVTLSTVNGIAFAAGIPVVGVSGLHALLYQAQQNIVTESSKKRCFIVLLNAFNADVYYLIAPEGATPWIGCKNSDVLLDELVNLKSTYDFVWIGNGVRLSVTQTDVRFDITSQHIVFTACDVACATAIGHLAYQRWQQEGGSAQVEPYYLKTQLFAVKK